MKDELAPPADGVLEEAAQTFGLREVQLAAEARVLRAQLSALWETTYGPPAVLRDDLQRMKVYFDPVASGARLRKAIGELAATEAELSALPPESFIDAGEGRVLITPEGRCALELLTLHSNDASVVVLDPAELQLVHLTLGDVYRAWGRHRLTQVVSLLQGQHKRLQVPAAAVVLALLINRNTDPERALARAPERDEQHLVDGTFFPAVDAFAEAVMPSTRRSTEKESLVSGWRLHEATRRAPHAFAVEADRIFIRPGFEDDLLDLVARELAARKQVDVAALTAGFDAMADELRQRLPRLETLGLAFERPYETERLRDELVARFRGIRERDAAHGAI